MLDTSIFGLLNDLKSSFFTHLDDDLVDRFNYYYTPLLLLLFAIFSGSQLFFGRSIECFLPPVIAIGGMESYAEQYCWVSNTYYVPVGDAVPGVPDRKELQLRYYQWVPFVLVLQALMCYSPCIIWRFLSWKTGIDLRLVVQLAKNYDNLDVETRERNCKAVALYLHHAFETHCNSKSLRSNNARCGLLKNLALSKHSSGKHLSTAYMLAKLLYCLNFPLQILIVCHFIGSPSIAFGYDYVFEMLWNNSDASRTRNFPVLTLCDIVTRSFANDQRYTVECVLPINMLNDKLFLFIWWWLALIGIVSVVNFFIWLYRLSSAKDRTEFVRKFLRLAKVEQGSNKKYCVKFIFHYLRSDGIIILRLFSCNCGPVITCDVLRLIWIHYIRMHARIEESMLAGKMTTSVSSNSRRNLPHGHGNGNGNGHEVSYKKLQSHQLTNSSQSGHSNNQQFSEDDDTVVFVPMKH